MDIDTVVIKTVVVDIGLDTLRVGLAKGGLADGTVHKIRGVDAGISRGIVGDWDKFEVAFKAILGDVLKVKFEGGDCGDCGGYRVYLALHSLTPKANREMLCRIFFEAWNARELHMENEAVCILAAVGLETGVSVRAESSGIWVVPVFESCGLPHAIQRLDIDPVDGFLAPGYDLMVDTVLSSIMKCDVDIRAELFANIMLAGDAACEIGAKDIGTSIQSKAPEGMNVSMALRDFLGGTAWAGAAKLSGTASDDQYISRQEYDESGPAVIYRK